MPRPDGKPEHAGTGLANGDYALLVLTGVEDGDPSELADATRELLSGRMAALSGRMDFMSLARSLRERADVKIMPRPQDVGTE
jgi:thiazole synthase ThiGH ThiG subunit